MQLKCYFYTKYNNIFVTSLLHVPSEQTFRQRHVKIVCSCNDISSSSHYTTFTFVSTYFLIFFPSFHLYSDVLLSFFSSFFPSSNGSKAYICDIVFGKWFLLLRLVKKIEKHLPSKSSMHKKRWDQIKCGHKMWKQHRNTDKWTHTTNLYSVHKNGKYS